MSEEKKFSRREFLKVAGIAGGASAVLAACGQAAEPTAAPEPTKAPEAAAPTEASSEFPALRAMLEGLQGGSAAKHESGRAGSGQDEDNQGWRRLLKKVAGAK